MPLLVVTDDIRRAAQKRQWLQNPVAGFGMFLKSFPLIICQCCLLVEYGIGHGELPDIVKNGAVAKVAQVIGDVGGNIVFGTSRVEEVNPPDSIDWGGGISYAMNPYLSLTTSFSSRFVMKTEFDGTEVDGSDQTIASLNFGVTYAMGRRSSMDLQIGVGLTDDTPDFTVRLSTPMVFNVPQFWENWGNWRLSRLFRF